MVLSREKKVSRKKERKKFMNFKISKRSLLMKNIKLLSY